MFEEESVTEEIGPNFWECRSKDNAWSAWGLTQEEAERVGRELHKDHKEK